MERKVLLDCVCLRVLTVGVVLEERSGKDDKSANSFASCKKKKLPFPRDSKDKITKVEMTKIVIFLAHLQNE